MNEDKDIFEPIDSKDLNYNEFWSGLSDEGIFVRLRLTDKHENTFERIIPYHSFIIPKLTGKNCIVEFEAQIVIKKENK